MGQYTVKKLFVAEIEEKRSRFIAHLLPAEEFEETLSRLKDQHRKASHHVTAFRRFDSSGRMVEQAKDDGEPAGTSGIPVLKTMTGANLVEAAIIVVRYFGGTKLGTGGLARAYSSSAAEVVSSANLVSWCPVSTCSMEAGFENSARIEQLATRLGLHVVGRDFHESGVRLTINGPQSAVEQLRDELG